ncbi:hypothetical protein ACHAXT_004286 [Thalassiosira profunda]
MNSNHHPNTNMESDEPSAGAALRTGLPGVTKANSRRYGSVSTGTISTAAYTSSSSSSSSQETNPTGANNNFSHLSLDLADIDNSDGSEDSSLLPGHSRESSYSDLSDTDDDGGGYYNRLARNRRPRDACYFIEHSLLTWLTWNNAKVLFSFVLWFVSYTIMGIFGGSVAYLHFERSDRDIPDPLPDFGYDVIPYYCPQVPGIPHGNVQSCVLFFLYAIIMSGVILRWRPRYHPKSGTVIWGGDGRLILQHLFHLNCLVFLSRTTTVGLTGLPQPNPKCVEQQHLPVSFGNALSFVMGRGLVPHACGDLIYSGHVGCTLICMAVLHRHGFLRHRLAAVSVWLVAAIGIYFTISCRSHYSVDVMLAFYFGYFLPEWYFNRSGGRPRVRGRISRLIRKMEVWPADLRVEDNGGNENGAKEIDPGCYPTTIDV